MPVTTKDELIASFKGQLKAWRESAEKYAFNTGPMGRMRGPEAQSFNWVACTDVVSASDFKAAYEELKDVVLKECPPWTLSYGRSGSLAANNVWDLKVERNNGQDPSKLNYHIKLTGNP
jgi:hypothetical protein